MVLHLAESRLLDRGGKLAGAARRGRRNRVHHEAASDGRLVSLPVTIPVLIRLIRLAVHRLLHHQPWPGSACARPVIRVVELAGIQREATAADAAVEPVAQALEHADAGVEMGAEAAADLFPVAFGRRALKRQLPELGADVLE